MPSPSLAGLLLRHLEYAITELRHFGRAAVRIGVSQAGLSAQGAHMAFGRIWLRRKRTSRASWPRRRSRT